MLDRRLRVLKLRISYLPRRGGNKPAQGNALGSTRSKYNALKGRNKTRTISLLCPFRQRREGFFSV
jgi:hypothetical protein